MFFSPLPKWAEYVLFASLLVAVCIIFSIMAYFYTYIDPAEIEAQFKMDTEDDENNKSKLQKLEVGRNKKYSTESHSEGKQTKLWTVYKTEIAN